jgi:WD40 repeat protein
MSAAPARINPFPGLRPFTQEEDYLFFGREEQTIELLQRLGGNRFVAVVGTSGSGKSSLVRCGLMSQLLGGKMLEAGASWEIAVTHPGGNPLALLTDALLEADLYDREVEHARENLLATLSRSHFGLVEAVRQADLGEGTNFLLVVDQFEEIFRFHEAGQVQQEAANEFVSLLLEAAAQKEAPIYVVLTMRSDFIGECGQFEGLAEMVNRGEFLIPRLNREQYKRIIEGPIKVAGGQIAPRLLQRLLNDLGQQADQLPCLQHALMRTWNVWAEKGDSEALDLDDYHRVGKMSQALSLHADEIYESLASDRQRALCQGIFQALTVEESNSRGIRRPQGLGRLCQILEAPADELRPIIDAYRQSGVTFLVPSPEVELTEQTILDISHESLMRVWTRLRQWVEEETQAVGIYHRLSESADLHLRGKAGLYRDPELGIALAWRDANRPNAAWAERYRPGFATSMKFLEASQQASVAEEQSREAARQHELEQAQQLAEAQQLRLEQQQRAARRLRLMIAGLAAVALIAGIACVAALLANLRAIRLAAIARQNEQKANDNASRAEQSQKDTATALAVVASQKAQVEGSLSKAEAAERLARNAEAAGRKLLYTTDMQLAPFLWRDDRTTAEQLRVLLAKHIPDNNLAADTGIIAAPVKSDLRGFEWYYYQHLLQSSATVFSGHAAPVVDAVFTTEGPLVTLDRNGQVRRWDLGSQHEDEASRREMPRGPGAEVRVLSPNGRLAAFAGWIKVRVHDTFTGSEKFSIDSTYDAGRGLIFSRDGEKLVIVDNMIRWVNAGGGEVLASYDANLNRVESLALSADGLTLAVVGHGTSGNLISVFRLDAAAKKVTPLAKDIGRGGTLSGSALTPDGGRIAVGYGVSSGTLSVFDTATGRLIAQHPAAHASPIGAITFDRDGAMLATADTEGTIKIWADLEKLDSKSAAVLTLKGHQGAINTVGFSIDGKRLVSASADKTARVWDVQNAGAAIRPLEGRSYDWSPVTRFSPDGQLIAAAGGRSVRLWDAATGRLVRELSPGDKGQVTSIAFSPTDNRLLAVGFGGEADVSYVALLDIDAGAELARLVDAYTGDVGALAFSPNGKYLVAGFGTKLYLTPANSPNPLNVWDVAARRLIRRLSGHTGYCLSLDFSRDGTFLASGSRDGTAIIWSTETWKAQQTLQNADHGSRYSAYGPGMVEDVAFSPDGKTLALASREGSVQIWDVATGKLLDTLKRHSGAVEAVDFSPDGRTLASGSSDQTVRLWNVETRRELMQLDPGGIQLRHVQSLAFSPDGQHLLADGTGAAFWSTTPVVWNDPDRAADQLRRLLNSNAGFQSRIRMLSENLRLHQALAKLDAKDQRVQAALAATQANWHASRKTWPEAVAAFDRLLAANPTSPEGWLCTPGLLRLATALVHQDRPGDAVDLLAGGASRRAADGIPPAVNRVSIGVGTSTAYGQVRVTGLLTGSPASRTDLLPGDVILKVNDTELTRDPFEKLDQLLSGEAGTKVRLTVRHSGSEKPAVIELTRERFVNDPATGEQLYSLREIVNERLTKDPQDARLLELRAELAGQWSDTIAQVADYTAAIDVRSRQTPAPATADLERLYRRRGNAYVALRQWQQALDDYIHVVTPETKDVELLSNRARAHQAVQKWEAAAADWSRAAASSPDGAKLLAEFARRLAAANQPALAKGLFESAQALYQRSLEENSGSAVVATELAQLLMDKHRNENISRWNVLQPAAMEPAAGPTSAKLAGNSIPAGGTSPPSDPYTVRFTIPQTTDIRSIRLELLPPDSLLEGGPGRSKEAGPAEGTFALIRWDLTAKRPDSAHSPRRLSFDAACADYSWNDSALGLPLEWNVTHPDAKSQISVWRLREPITLEAGSELVSQMHFNRRPDWSDQNLGRFRIAVSGDSAAFDREATRSTAMKQTDPWSKLAAGCAAIKLSDQAMGYFAKALQEAEDYEAKKPIVQLAARFDEVLAALIKQQPDDPQLRLALARRLAEHGTRLLAEEQPREAQSELEKSRDAFTRLLPPDDHWKVPTPVEMKSESGAKMELQKDGSVFVHEIQSRKNDAYALVFPIDLKGITGLRLEVLPDYRLLDGGPGWGIGGDFLLSELTLRVGPAESPNQVRSIALKNASADFSRGGNDVRGVIDDRIGTAWSIEPQLNKAHTAVFETAEKVGNGGAARLTVELRHRTSDTSTLGRFRLSFTNDAATLQATRTRLDLRDSELLDCNIALGKAHAQLGQTSEAAAALARALEWAIDRPGKGRIVAEAAQLEGVLGLLAERAVGNAQFQAELARHFADRGDAPLAEAARTKARLLLEQKLVQEPENPARAADLADVLLFDSDARWTILKPTQMKSEGGADLAPQPDGSILASGVNPDRDSYTINTRVDLGRIRALRLEALPDPSLPGNGPGRDHIGNFHLNAFRLFSGTTLAKLDGVFATYHEVEQLDQIVGGTIAVQSWSIWPRLGQRHTAFFGADFVHAVGDELKFEMDFSRGFYKACNLGRFRLSASGDPAIFERERKHVAARKITDPWAMLATAYHLNGDQQALDTLVKRHPEAASAVADLYAALQDWGRAIDEYRRRVIDERADVALLTKLATAYQSAGRTREAIAVLAQASAADAKDTLLALKVAALQAWFGQETEFAATRQRILAVAKDTQEARTAERAATACSILPCTEKAQLKAALALGRGAMKSKNGVECWNLLSLGMSEYRCGNDAAALEALIAAGEAGANNPDDAPVTGISSFFRAMSLFRQGKRDDARKLAIAAVAKMKPLPADERNPLAGSATHNDLILWLVYKEAKAMIQFDAAPATPATPNGK